MPLLYVDAVAGLWRTDPGFSPAETVDRAIGHIVELQRGDGSFGVWSDTDDTVPWLDAYATDFLIRAREHRRDVPEFAIKAALGWLRDYVRQEHTRGRGDAGRRLCALRAGARRAGDVADAALFQRYAAGELPTQLAKAQLGAALARAGDMTRANAAYAAALERRLAAAGRAAVCRLRQRIARQRRRAALLPPAIRAGPPRLTEMMDRVAELFARAKRTSTQEQAWLLMAAEAAVRGRAAGTMTTATGDAPPQTGSKPVYLRRQLGSSAAPLTIGQPRCETPAWRTVSVTGVPRGYLLPESSGYSVSPARCTGATARPADLSGMCGRADLFVVVIKGSREPIPPAAGCGR